jgi:Flp pilus assembly protein TadG
MIRRWESVQNGTRREQAGCESESDSGQALVEVAVTLSLLVLIILGAVQYGQIAYTSIEVANAAKAGVQYGAQSGFTAEDTTGISNAAKAAAPDLSALSVTSSYGCVCADGTSSTCALGDCSSSRIIESVTVNTQLTLTPIIHIPALAPVINTAAQASSITLYGLAVQRCAQ